MKKKAIERIPYLGLKKASRKKDVKYIGVTAVRIVGHEKHLFLEMYRNAKNQTEPVVRIVLNKRDFGTYLPESGEWTRQKIKADSRGGKLIWLTHEDYRSDWQHLEKKNILQSGEDLKRLKEFCKTTTWNEDRWWDYVMKFQDDITFSNRLSFMVLAGLYFIISKTTRMRGGEAWQEQEIQTEAKHLRFTRNMLEILI